MITRTIVQTLQTALAKSQIVLLTGAYMSGKTFLTSNLFNDFTVISFQAPDIRLAFQADSSYYIHHLPNNVIIDDIHRLPQFIESLLQHHDQIKHHKIILCGDHNLTDIPEINQVLTNANIKHLTLLNPSLLELRQTGTILNNLETLIFSGFFPSSYNSNNPTIFFDRYINSYINSEIYKIKILNKYDLFFRFIKLCAGRVATLINMSELAYDCGVSINTIKAWLNLLESSYIIYRLYPHPVDYNKRLVKMPKLYFYDTGLLCFLLGIKAESELLTHFLIGKIFENFIINEFLKHKHNKGENLNFFFWRDSKGKEIDLLINVDQKLIPIELKAGKNIIADYFKGITYWNKISGNTSENSIVIYGGDETRKMNHGLLLSWKDLPEFISLIL